MIKLINNELLKIGYIKLLTHILLFILTIIIMHYLDINISDKIYEIIPFIGVDLCILFGGIMSNEYQSGTIRIYLTKPHSRTKILTSKLLTMIFYTLILTIVVLITCILFTNNVNIVSYFVQIVPLLLICILILFLSSIFKNPGTTISISIVLLFTAQLITELFLLIDFTIVEYTFLPYLDFNLFNDELLIKAMNLNYDINLSINRGIIINVLYSIIFYILTIYLFNKKDIKY